MCQALGTFISILEFQETCLAVMKPLLDWCVSASKISEQKAAKRLLSEVLCNVRIYMAALAI